MGKKGKKNQRSRVVVLLGDTDTVDAIERITPQVREQGLAIGSVHAFPVAAAHEPLVDLGAIPAVVEALAAAGAGKCLLVPFPEADFAGPHQLDALAEAARLRGSCVLVGPDFHPWRAGSHCPTAMSMVRGWRYILSLVAAAAAKAAEPALIDEALAALADDRSQP